MALRLPRRAFVVLGNGAGAQSCRRYVPQAGAVLDLGEVLLRLHTYSVAALNMYAELRGVLEGGGGEGAKGLPAGRGRFGGWGILCNG